MTLSLPSLPPRTPLFLRGPPTPRVNLDQTGSAPEPGARPHRRATHRGCSVHLPNSAGSAQGRRRGLGGVCETKWGQRSWDPTGSAPTPTGRAPLAAGAGGRRCGLLFKEKLLVLKEREQTSSASRNHTFWKSQAPRVPSHEDRAWPGEEPRAGGRTPYPAAHPMESETPARWEGIYGGPNDPWRQDQGWSRVGERTLVASIHEAACPTSPVLRPVTKMAQPGISRPQGLALQAARLRPSKEGTHRAGLPEAEDAQSQGFLFFAGARDPLAEGGP